MSETKTITIADGTFSAYVARPRVAGPRPAVVVIQEIFGVNQFVRKTADDLAAAGYLAIAPDLFWRIQPGIDITDQTDEEWKQAFGYFNAFDVDAGVQDIYAAISAIRYDAGCTGVVGAVGYCLGGRLAYLAATRTDVDAAVGYYPVGLPPLLGEAVNITRPLMLHIAEEDGFVSKEDQKKAEEVLELNPHVTLHSYPGRDHAFARDGGAHYHAEDAALANGRTLEFFKTHLE